MTHPNISSVAIRKAKMEDAVALNEMITRNVDHFHINNYTKEELAIWHRGYSVSEIETHIQNRLAFVLETKGAIRGSIQFDSSEIKGFYIDPQLENQGLGRQLFQFMLAYLIEKGEIEIQLTSNKWTIGFYEKFGFELVEKEIVYWENHPFTEYRMKLTKNALKNTLK
jgi:ribosomal protein S18 acetylase RimI-like enzyme